jgi:hypothetical protein
MRRSVLMWYLIHTQQRCLPPLIQGSSFKADDIQYLGTNLMLTVVGYSLRVRRKSETGTDSDEKNEVPASGVVALHTYDI